MVKKLKLTLSAIDQVNFKIFADGHGEETSKLPFSDAQLFTVLSALDVIGTDYKSHQDDDQNWMKQAGVLSQEDSQFFHPQMTKNIGRHLYKSFFFGNIEQALLKKLGETQGESLHIQIQYAADVIESSYLPLYPWQLVHDGNEFLAEYRATFSYLIAHKNPSITVKRKVEQIKVLIVSSTAYDEQHQSIKSKESVINQALTKASQQGYVSLLSWYQKSEKPTVERLRSYLTEQNGLLDILHFDGHAFFKRKCPNPVCPTRNTNQGFYSLTTKKCQSCRNPLEEPQGFLFFDKDESGIEYVSAADFATLVGGKPMLVVITACKAALAYKSDSIFNGVAQKLLRQVPAVVATPFSLSEESATKFVEQLYRALGAKKSLLEAVKLATDAMCYHKYEWYRPVIFLGFNSDEDGNLFELQEAQHLPFPREMDESNILSESDAKVLKDLLNRSGMTSFVGREDLCHHIGININDLSPENLKLVNDNIFISKLMGYLQNTGNIIALKNLCERMEPMFKGGLYQNKLKIIQDKLIAVLNDL